MLCLIMRQLQAWTNDASMESKILAALAKRTDVEAGHHETGHIAGLRARSSNFGGLASRTSSMASLAGYQDHAAEHHPDHPERHRQMFPRPTGCCLAAVIGLLLLLGVVLLVKQRARSAAMPVVTISAKRLPAPAATVTAAAVTAGLTKAGAHCAQLCLAEAKQLVEKQPEITEGARGAAYDLCFSRCAASSPADAAVGGTALPVRLHRKVAAGGLTMASSVGNVEAAAQAAASAAQHEQRQ